MYGKERAARFCCIRRVRETMEVAGWLLPGAAPIVKTPVCVWVDMWASDPGSVYERVSLVGFWLPGLTFESLGDEQFGVAGDSLCLGGLLSEGT